MAKTKPAAKADRKLTGRELLESVSKEHQYKMVALDDLGVPGSVKVRSLTGGEYASIMARQFRTEGDDGKVVTRNFDGHTVRMVRAGLCNEDGTQMYTEDEEDRVARFPADVLIRLSGEIQELTAPETTTAERAENLK
ncbi:MAG: hypothetical protein F4Y26_00475 [Gammaproteobacteria bacterium]|nr:hypothetical protein [Gammaproteobacteria bacterium]